VDALTIFLFIIGLGLLIAGAEVLVRGASSLATLFGISPLVVGLTVVSFGTSSPELAVATRASFSGQADIAMGNVVGSNIFNILFILGLTATIAPLVVSKQLVRLDVPIMIGATVVMLLMALDGAITRMDGFILFAGIVAYITYEILHSRREVSAEATRHPQDAGAVPEKRSVPILIAMIVGGLAMLIVGSTWLVNGAVGLATALGVSELVIGLTIVSIGTSLPEIATSIMATLRGERDIAVGNVVGSNIFNVLAILGLTAIVAPRGVPVAPATVAFDIPVALVAALACLPIFFTGRLIARWEGIVFLGYYVAYTLYLVLDASRHDALSTYSTAMLAFVLPLTVATIAYLAIREWRSAARMARRGG
jgi:cation:H+ antiporter